MLETHLEAMGGARAEADDDTPDEVLVGRAAEPVLRRRIEKPDGGAIELVLVYRHGAPRVVISAIDDRGRVGREIATMVRGLDALLAELLAFRADVRSTLGGGSTSPRPMWWDAGKSRAGKQAAQSRAPRIDSAASTPADGSVVGGERDRQAEGRAPHPRQYCEGGAAPSKANPNRSDPDARPASTHRAPRAGGR